MYFNFIDDTKTHDLAYQMFNEAAQKGQNFQAIYNLGEMHHYGLAVPKSCSYAATVRILQFFFFMRLNCKDRLCVPITYMSFFVYM